MSVQHVKKPAADERPVVLLVDDRPRNLQLFGNALSGQGYDVAYATSGKEALGIIAESQPDLVLLDVMMPEMDGYEVCRRIKANPDCANLEVIFVTARTRQEDILEAFNAGGVDYITKPTQMAEVLARVNCQVSLKRARDAFVHTNRSLAAAIETQRRLNGILSHDVRAPLFALRGALEECLRSAPELNHGDLVDMVRTCFDSSNRLVSFFEDLLAWAGSEVGTDGENTREPFSVADALEAAIGIMEDSAVRKEVRIERKVEGNLVGIGDAKVLNTVVRNLLSNAIKFSSRRGRVVVAASAAGEKYIAISVTDEGVGMRTEEIGVLFDSSRVRSSLGTENEKGSGLGLLLCRNLVYTLGGDLTVESEVGKGTVFSFFLPMAEMGADRA